MHARPDHILTLTPFSCFGLFVSDSGTFCCQATDTGGDRDVPRRYHEVSLKFICNNTASFSFTMMLGAIWGMSVCTVPILRKRLLLWPPKCTLSVDALQGYASCQCLYRDVVCHVNGRHRDLLDRFGDMTATCTSRNLLFLRRGTQPTARFSKRTRKIVHHQLHLRNKGRISHLHLKRHRGGGAW